MTSRRSPGRGGQPTPRGSKPGKGKRTGKGKGQGQGQDKARSQGGAHEARPDPGGGDGAPPRLIAADSVSGESARWAGVAEIDGRPVTEPPSIAAIIDSLPDPDSRARLKGYARRVPPGFKLVPVLYAPVTARANAALWREFDRGVQARFLAYLGAEHAQALAREGFDARQIAQMQTGRRPTDETGRPLAWDVDHIIERKGSGALGGRRAPDPAEGVDAPGPAPERMAPERMAPERTGVTNGGAPRYRVNHFANLVFLPRHVHRLKNKINSVQLSALDSGAEDEASLAPRWIVMLAPERSEPVLALRDPRLRHATGAPEDATAEAAAHTNTDTAQTPRRQPPALMAAALDAGTQALETAAVKGEARIAAQADPAAYRARIEAALSETITAYERARPGIAGRFSSPGREQRLLHLFDRRLRAREPALERLARMAGKKTGGHFLAAAAALRATLDARLDPDFTPDPPLSENETGPKETGARETGTRETGTRETGTRETGTRETGARETGASNAGPDTPPAANRAPAVRRL